VKNNKNTQIAFESAVKRYGKKLDLDVLGRFSIEKRYQERDHHISIAQRFNDSIETLTCCPICTSANFELFLDFHGFRYVECDDCGHLFGLDRINEDGLKILYSTNKSAHSHLYFDENQYQKCLEAIELPKVNFVADYLRPKLGKTWLDIGASVGRLVMAAKQKGWSVWGVDTDPSAVAVAQRLGLNVSNLYITQENVTECLRDVQIVSLLGVLEHFNNPFDFLFMLSRGLESGSSLLIEVPRHPSLTGFAMKAMPENISRYIMPMHQHVFSDRSLELVLSETGFEAKAIWYFGQDYFETLSVLHMTHSCEIPQILRNPAERIQEVIDGCGLSDTMLVLAQRQPINV
jgi:2-polyprenyl-3-methyl-5-hydroxy-6-metoxy-1,4-benzoquinol methylase